MPPLPCAGNARVLLFAVPLVGERLDGMTLAFAVAVIATVYVGKKMPVGSIAGASK